MSIFVDHFFEEHVPRFTRSLQHLQDHVSPEEEPCSDELTRQLTDRINESLTDCARLESQLGDEKPKLYEIQKAYREAIWPWFGQSWFMCRALEKPRGYPGDFETLSAIYDGEVKSRGLGGYLDRYFLATTLACAVRGRMRAVRQFLLEELSRRTGDVTILNVACGPCREYAEHFRPQHDGNIRLVCVDNDTEALDFVKTSVAPRISDTVQWEFVPYNALRMSKPRRNVDTFGHPDIIYSVGLCDYLSDRVLVPILSGWRESLGENGIVHVAFKDAERYETPEYQWLVDWFFLQRTEPECRRLFEESGYDMEHLELNRDMTEVILQYVGRSPVREVVRVDKVDELPAPPHVTTATEPQKNSTGKAS
jgi:hypothetical protein